MKTFVDRIDIIANKVGGITELSRRTGLSKTVLHKYKRGESDPSRERLELLASAASVSVQWLATGKEPTYSESFAERLNEIADKVGGSEALAKETGINHDNMLDYLDGMRTPQAASVVAIAEAGGVSLEWLMVGNEGNKKPSQKIVSDYQSIDIIDIPTSIKVGEVICYDDINKSVFVNIGLAKRVHNFNSSDLFAIPSPDNISETYICSKADEDLKFNDGSFVMKINDNIVIKKIQVHPDKIVKMHDLNKQLESFSIQLDELMGTDIDVRLLGKIVLTYRYDKV